MNKLIKETIALIKKEILSKNQLRKATEIYKQNNFVILSQGEDIFSVLITDDEKHIQVSIIKNEEKLIPKVEGKKLGWNLYAMAALLVIEEETDEEGFKIEKKYTREEMKLRVLEERKERARKAAYKVKLSKNLYGEHLLINEKGQSYKITLRDFEKQTGYIDNFDLKTNKLGTTKHILYLFNYLEDNPAKKAKLKKKYPFIEIYTDPQNEYKISWHFPDELAADESALLDFYFENNTCIENSELESFSTFIYESADFQRIKIRQEVLDKLDAFFENKELARIKDSTSIDFSALKTTLYPYQEEGISFSVYKKGVIIADEMGLGKTLQAIGTAILKKEIFGFQKTLVITPASVKHQWQNEVLKFTDEKAIVVEGLPEEREKLYLNDASFFHIINYETVLRDLSTINKVSYDFVILDEAQKIKNYDTKTANSVKAINRKHALVITGTPLENKILDLYSIVQFIDPYFLAPQWEFSYQHCIFDSTKKNKILGYYNLQNLKERLNAILIRREKEEVLDQLPNLIEKNVFVSLSDHQASLHASFAGGIAKILGKKFKTLYDWQRLMLLLNSMRMVCDSSFLVDKETNDSPKLIELQDILFEKLDIKNNNRKIIIFSEWVTMLNLIGDDLKKEGITFAKLTGKVPVKKRGDLIKEFEKNPDCKVFLSTEAGGTGLNLQMADTVINFELPWNPAKKNQRIGRINRIGQKKNKLNIFNLISYDSIEMKIAGGLLLKQNLFDGILSPKNTIDEVDFSNKGKSQFIQQLEEVIADNDVELTESQMLPEGTGKENLTEKTVSVSQSIASKEESKKPQKTASKTDQPQTSETKKQPNYNEMEEVMTKGMEFLTGIFKMSTGKELSKDGKPKVTVNKETGEISISFKMEL